MDQEHTSLMTPSDAQPVSQGGWLSRERRPISTLVATNFVSLFSNQLTAIAVPWFVLELTGSATRTGLTAAATLLPAILMAFFGGAVVDRMSARKMSIFSDVMSGVTVAMVPLLYVVGVLNFPLLMLLMFLGAVFDSPGSTARGTMMPRLAERAGIPLERLNSAFGVSQSISSLFGAVIAGVLVSILGPTNVLWFNAAAFVLSASAMVLLVPELEAHPPSGETLMEDIRAGIRWLWSNGALRTTIFAALVINAIFSPIAAVVLPYYAKTIFDSATALGILMSGFGAGSLIGAISYGVFGTRIKRRTLMVTSVALISLPVLGMIALPSLWIAWLLQFLIGIGVGAVNPMVGTIIMRVTPGHMLGRVSGVFRAGAMVASPLGVLLAGPLIALVDLRGVFVVFSVGLLGVLVAIVTNTSIHEFDDDEPDAGASVTETAAVSTGI
jgi:MFS family permease